MTTGENVQPTSSEEISTSTPHIISSVEQLHEGVTYLLPHELIRVQDLLAKTEAELKVLAEQRFEAMHQSSETWHDNAPAEAIKHTGEVPGRRRDKLDKMLRSQFILDYPSKEIPFATIGSRVLIKVGQTEPFTIDIVGAQTESTDSNPDIEESTYRSPLAIAIIGKSVGETPLATIGDRTLEVTILGIDQEAQQLEYS